MTSKPLWIRMAELFSIDSKAPRQQRERVANIVWTMRNNTEAEIVEVLRKDALVNENRPLK